MRDSENIDLYAVLQVHPTAEPEIVDAAYRRLARMYHPDVNKAPGAHETMIRINLAYEILGDPAKRAAYDRDRANRQQTEWQAWTERAERERRERAERAEHERRAQAEREQRERSEQTERERRARANAERQRAEREQRERQAQANPTHQSYAEWEAEMQRQVRASAERQQAEREQRERQVHADRDRQEREEQTEAEPNILVGITIIIGLIISPSAIAGVISFFFNTTGLVIVVVVQFIVAMLLFYGAVFTKGCLGIFWVMLSLFVILIVGTILYEVGVSPYIIVVVSTFMLTVVSIVFLALGER